MLSVQLAAILAVAAGGETVLLDFSASWCGPCQQLSPVIDELAAQGYPVRKVDIDQQPDLAAQYGVTKVPTLILLKNGQPVSRGLGVLSFAQLEGMLQKHGISPAGAEAATVRGQSPEAGGGLFGLGLFSGRNSGSAAASGSSQPARSLSKSSPEVEAQKEANGPAPRWNPSAAAAQQSRLASTSRDTALTPALSQREREPFEDNSREKEPSQDSPVASAPREPVPLQPLRPAGFAADQRERSPGGRPMSGAGDDLRTSDESRSGWRSRVSVAAEPAGTRRTALQEQLEERLLEASVRITIKEADGKSYGSGTFIDQRSGEALILTCGHIFRESQGRAAISVDLYEQDSRRELSGRLIYCDLDRDVGLVSVRTERPVVTARVAPPGHAVRSGETVLSIGCDGGRPPAARWSRVLAVDSIVGPPNLQVEGQPQEGRSGGGLFNQDGLVVGVCNFADPTDRAGLFAALAAVHSTMDAAGLAMIYRDAESFESDEPTRLVAQPAGQPGGPPPGMPSAMPKSASPSVAADHRGEPEQPRGTGLTDRSQTELICIVRPVDGNGGSGELIVINNASQELLSMLSTERRRSHGQFETALETRSGGPQPSRSEREVDSNGWRTSAR